MHNLEKCENSNKLKKKKGRQEVKQEAKEGKRERERKRNSTYSKYTGLFMVFN